MSNTRLSLGPSMQGYVLLVPALTVYLLFAVYPMMDVVRMSFSSWNGLSPEARFVGMENYRAIFTQDPVFWGALWNTLAWTFFAVLMPTLINFGLALALKQNIPGKSSLRVIFYLPVIIASIAVATIWKCST
jgi:raffinose/stachyose/melibiose transport system permease protein